MVDPVSGARGIIRDTCADEGIPISLEHHPLAGVSSNRPRDAPEGLHGRGSITEEALRAYAEDFRMHTKVTRADPPSLDAHPGS